VKAAGDIGSAPPPGKPRRKADAGRAGEAKQRGEGGGRNRALRVPVFV